MSMRNVPADVRYALRVLSANPVFAAVAILSLALGIGANTAIFSLVDGVLLKWLPVSSPQELVLLARTPDKPSVTFNYPDYAYIRDHNHVFSGVIASSNGSAPIGFTVPGEASAVPQLIAGNYVSGNYFEVLGVTPALGRLFTSADNITPGAHPITILSYGFWQTRFGGDRRVIGRKITLNGAPFTIAGVARPGFTGTAVGLQTDLYIPIMMLQQVDARARNWNSRHYWWLTVIGRKKPAVDLAQATAEADILFHQIDQNDPEHRPAPSFDKDRDRRNRAVLLPGSQGFSYLRRRMSKPLVVLMVVAGLVLLIACANIANLLLARAAARQKEIAVRLSVGASRGRLIAQLLIETSTISVLGGAAGLAMAFWGAHALVLFIPRGFFPVSLDLSPDLRVLGFCLAVSLLTGMACGLIPAVMATRPDLSAALKGEINPGTAVSPGRFDLRKGLVVAQVALSLLLLIGAGLFVRSLQNLHDLDPGFRRENLLMIGLDPSQNGYKGQRLREFYDRLLDRARALPGVRNASLAAITPLSGSRWNQDVAFQDYRWKPQEKPYIDMNAVSADYFETMGTPLLYGRKFRAEDNPAFVPDPPARPGPEEAIGDSLPPRVAIINETMARRFFPNQSALGRRFTLGKEFKMENSFEVVGVVKDSRYFGLRETVESMILVPNWRLGASGRVLCIRTAADPGGLTAAVRRETAAIDPSIPVLSSHSMEQQLDDNISQERITAFLCGFFGLLALLLAAVGLYGLMAHSVTRRTREIGIRMALGARRPDVLWLVLRDVTILLLLGALIGVPGALALTRLVTSFLYGLTPQDPATIGLATGILLLVTLLAGYLPARRATRVDPMVALRWE